MLCEADGISIRHFITIVAKKIAHISDYQQFYREGNDTASFVFLRNLIIPKSSTNAVTN